MKIKQRKQSLSLNLLHWTFFTALAVGILLSIFQVIYTAQHARQVIERDGQRILTMFADPSRQALYNLDAEMAEQVVKGLLHHEAIRKITIGHPQETPLAEHERPLQQGVYRFITDPIFASQKTFTLALEEQQNGQLEYYGNIEIIIDTAPYGVTFIHEAVIVFISGILRALVLALVFHLIYRALLTKPLADMVENISSINPDRPSQTQLKPIKGHENNELGVWIQKTNQLFASIERNTHLRHEAENNLMRLSQVDHLTGLPNRQELQIQLEQALLRAEAANNSVAIMCVGLDGFKGVNERYTYQTGDWLLNAFAQRIATHFADDIKLFSRLGGDQFVALQADVEHPYQSASLAQKILKALELPFVIAPSAEIGEVKICLSATIGIALYPDDAEDAENLIQKAEQTMMLAKSGSRNRYQFYIASIDREMRKRRQLENDLKEAIGKGQMNVVYQPQICYSTGKFFGAEALLRWQHPEFGWIAPDTFIPLAEQSGSIVAIGGWVLEQVCQQLTTWLKEENMQGFKVAVNLSTVQLHHTSLAVQVARLLEVHQLPAGSLEVEVTETSLMQDVNAAKRNLQALRNIAVSIAIDDFGTGYSSLSYLKSMPLDKIKIDRSFVQDALTSEDDATIVRAIIQLGHSLGLKVLAEGIETKEMEDFVVSLGCDEGQGYYYSKPASPLIIGQLLKDYALARR